MTRAAQITDCNAAFFDAANHFAGCVPGIHEVLRRQGLLAGAWCLDPKETLSPGQAEEIKRVYRAYPQLNDDAFVQHAMAAQQRLGERAALAAQGIVELSPVGGRQVVARHRQHVVLLHLHVAEVDLREGVHQGLEVVAAAAGADVDDESLDDFSDFPLDDFSPELLSDDDLSEEDLSEEDDLLPDESGDDFFA